MKRLSALAVSFVLLLACGEEEAPRRRARGGERGADETGGSGGTMTAGSAGSGGSSGGAAGSGGGTAAAGAGGSGAFMAGGSGGAGGSAAATGTAGAGGKDGGAPDAASPDAGGRPDGGAGDGGAGVAAGTTFRIDVPCKSATFVSPADTCPWDPAKFSKMASVTKTLDGDPSTTFDVVLRVRGVVEPRTYTDADGKPAATTATKPVVLVGGTPVPGNDYNAYRVEIASPSVIYYVNAYKQVGHLTFAIDHMITAKVKGGSAMTLGANDRNTEIISNYKKLVIAGVAPAPEPFNGQFVQVDVVSVTPAK